MPELIIPIIGLAFGGVELGTSIAGVGKPSEGDAQKQMQQQLDQQKAAQDKADQQAKQKAILANLANAQNQTGGNVNNPGLVDLASIIAGLPGEATGAPGQGALSQYLGTGSGSGTGTGSSLLHKDDNLVSATYGSLSGSQG